MPVDVEQQLAALGKIWNETIAHVEASEIASRDTARSSRSVIGIDGMAAALTPDRPPGIDQFTEEEATMIDLEAPSHTDEHRKGPKRVLVAAVLAAAAVVAIALVAIRNDDPVSPADQPSPTVTVPTTVASPPQTSAAQPADRPCPNPDGGFLNHCLGALDPGTYRTTTFEPSFRYTVPAGWWNIQDTSGNYVLLPPGESLSSFDMGVSDYIGVYASVAAPAGCDVYPDSSVVTTVQAYVGWLQEQPSLLVSEPTPIVVGGLNGTQVDVSLSNGPACSDPDVTGAFLPVLIGTNSSLLGYESGERSDRVDAGTRFRLILFDRPDGTLMVIELADTGNEGDDSWWTTAAEITNTFEFEP